MPRYAARVDANHAEIVKALRDVGCSVESLASIGHDLPDLLVGHHGETYLLEVKDGAKPPSRRRVTPGQKRWHALWRGRRVDTVINIDEAYRAVGIRLSQRGFVSAPGPKGGT